MKYKALYNVLNERRLTVPGFCYTDRSGWRSFQQSYIDHYRPLWIIAEDPFTCRRFWITQEGSNMQITVGKMDKNGHNNGTIGTVNCNNKTILAEKLKNLFVQEEAVNK